MNYPKKDDKGATLEVSFEQPTFRQYPIHIHSQLEAPFMNYQWEIDF